MTDFTKPPRASVMRAMLLTDGGPKVVDDYPVPAPGPGDALVRVRLAGVCSTDLELTRGYKGGFRGVLGHEFVGEVVEAAGSPDLVGRRVVGEINVGCGQCALCRRGLHKHCLQRRVIGIHGMDGCFAEYLTLPAASLHAVPDSLPDEAAVFAEPAAAACQVAEQVHIQPSMRVYVLGPGRLGLLVAQVLARTGCHLIVVGRRPEALARARDLGLEAALSADAGALTADPADVVVEVTGSPEGFALARRMVRPAGTIVLKSTYAGDQPAFDASGLVVDEITLVGSRCGPFEPALGLLASGAVQVAPLLTARYPLAEGVAALDHARRPGALKVLLEPAG